VVRVRPPENLLHRQPRQGGLVGVTPRFV